MLTFRKLLAICAISLFATASAGAQVLYGSITGTVTDAGGAVLPNATVKVTNVETAQEASVSTNDVGGYTLSSLAPGTYDIVRAVARISYADAAGRLDFSKHSPP